MTEHRSPSALASILLTTHLLRRTARPLSTGEYWKLMDTIGDPAKLLGAQATEVMRLTLRDQVEAGRLMTLLDGATALALELEKLGQSGIHVLSAFDDAFPGRLIRRLGSNAPPHIYAAGSPALLQTDGIGIVGSRSVGEEARNVAAEVARFAASNGLPVISGLAKGIDQVAMSSALEVEGLVVGIPADALNKLVRDPSVRRAITSEQLCLATPFIPSAGFSVGAAMARNKLIYALARVTLVVTSNAGSGGTWAGAVEALDRNIGPVAVWTGAGAGTGNEKLQRRGAFAINEPAALLPLDRKMIDATHDRDTQLRMPL